MSISKILEFVPPNFSKDAAALVIDSEEILTDLRKLMPNAEIFFLAEEKSQLCESLKIKFFQGDYTKNLPTEAKIFDVVIAEEILTFAPDFYRTLLEINHLLKDSGFLLTKFFNVRFIGILESLRRGEFPAKEKRLWAKWDVVKILDDAIYKEIRFLPDERFEEKISAVKSWENFGFDNFSDDLITKIWLVKARKCTAEVAALKEIYTLEIRAELSRILHRIEYGIDAEENFSKLIEFCRRENIFYDYLSDFIEQVVIHKKAADLIKIRIEQENLL